MTTVIKNRRTKQEQNPKLAWVMPCKKEEDESQRAGGAAVVIEHDGSIISRDVISDLHTTEFRSQVLG